MKNYHKKQQESYESIQNIAIGWSEYEDSLAPEGYEPTYYEINYKGTKISDELVVPYQTTIDGEKYTITEANIGTMDAGLLPSVKTIVYPNTVHKICNARYELFYGYYEDNTITENIILPQYLEEISDGGGDGEGDGGVFAYQKITSISLPKTLKIIGSYAFSNCSNLTSINIPDSVTSIGNYAFSYCSGLTSINIPNSVTSIGNSAFSDCRGLTSINLGDSVTIIGNSAFYSCSGLTSINIPNSVTSIGNSAFSSCRGLTSITVDSGNKVYDSRDNCNAIIEKNTNSLIVGCNTTIIPDGVTSIGNSAFSSCRGLTSINIPNSVTSIGERAFSYCRGLTSINIPDSVTSIGNSAFDSCSGLKSINIPDSVTSIGSYAFDSCSGLTTINIPDSVTSIGERAFYYCSGLTEINCQASSKPSGWSNNWNSECSAKVKWGVSM